MAQNRDGPRASGAVALVHPPVLVDSHCHLDEIPDPMIAVTAARRAGFVIVAVTSSPRRFRTARDRFSGLPQVRVALGLHPLTAGRVSERDLREFLSLARTTAYIGEVGLDRSIEGQRTWSKQKTVFERLLSDPDARRRLWSVHSRRAEVDVISALEQSAVPAILHWYSGPTRLIDRALSAGLYFSINPSMLGSVAGKRVLAALPAERVLSETDAPYGRGTPDPLAGILEVIRGLAEAWNLTPDEARRVVYDNTARAFGATRQSGAGSAAALASG